MSLSKSYRLACEGTDLHLRRQYNKMPEAVGDVPGREDRRELRQACAFATSEYGTAKDARTGARKSGWVRHCETMPLWHGAPESSDIKYDLCPACASALATGGAR